MATWLVTLAPEEEQALDLVKYFHKLHQLHKPGDEAGPAAFLKETEELAKSKQYKELLTRLVGLQGLVFQHAPEKEIEGCFNLIGSLLRKLDNDTVTNISQKLTADLVANNADRPSLRLKILTNLYNLFEPTSPLRYEVFVRLARYASDTGYGESIVQQLDKLDTWVKEWQCTPTQTRALYKLAVDILRKQDRRLKAHEFEIKLLQAGEGSSTAVEDAKAVAVDAVMFPEVVQTEHLLEIPAIKQLDSADPVGRGLFELLKLFATGTLETFNAFVKSHPGFLESVPGLVQEDCLRKIRLLTLTSLAAEHEEIPYAAVATALQVSEEEVELWVIQAIGVKLIEAKMDQMRRVIIVRRATQRVFTNKQWENLRRSLGKWRETVGSLLKSIQSSKVRANHTLTSGSAANNASASAEAKS